MIKNLSVRKKMLLILGLVIIVTIMLSSIFFVSFKKVELYSKIELNLVKLNLNVLTLRKNEKNFFLRNDIYYADKFNKNYSKNLLITNDLVMMLEDVNIKSDYTNKYLKIIEEYKDYFVSLVEYKKYIGLNEKLGLYGYIRSNVHTVEDFAIKNNNYKTLAHIYELRKFEKDFMLRKKIIYLNKFKQLYIKTYSMLENENIKKSLTIYYDSFLNLAQEEVSIGLDENLGLRGLMRETIHQTNDIIKLLSSSAIYNKNKQVNSMMNYIVIIALSSIFIVLIIIFIIYSDLMKSLEHFSTGLGDFFDYLNKKKSSLEIMHINRDDEFGVMIKLINDNIKNTTNFLEKKSKELEKMAYYDALTGIYNRSIVNELFNSEVKNMKRNNETMCALIVDIDDFKKVNDTYGHDVGDNVLVEFVKVTKTNIREVDIFVRWGGEEFIILLPNTNIKNAKFVAEKVRLGIQNHKINDIGNITISLGLSEYIAEDTIETLIKRCDIALYEAKDSGKNKVVII